MFNNDWCARKADLAADGGGWPVLPARFDSVLSGAVLDVAIIPGSDDVLWIDDAAGGRLGRSRRRHPLNDIATNANVTYRVFALPAPAAGNLWNAYMQDIIFRVDLLASWTTDKPSRRKWGISWPYNHLDLDQVPIVRTSGAELSIPDWPGWPGRRRAPALARCARAAALSSPIWRPSSARVATSSTLPPARPRWVTTFARASSVKASLDTYVLPMKDAEKLLVGSTNSGGMCDLRMIVPSGSERAFLKYGAGGFSTVDPFAREQYVRRIHNDPSATTGGRELHRHRDQSAGGAPPGDVCHQLHTLQGGGGRALLSRRDAAMPGANLPGG